MITATPEPNPNPKLAPLRRVLAPRPIWMRIVSILGGLVLLLVSFVVLGILGIPSAAGGWLPTAVGLLPALLVLVLGAGLGRPWWVACLVAAVLALLIGTWDYRTSPPEPERLTAVADDVGAPAGWRQIEAGSGGSTWGLFGDWPRYDATYASNVSATEAAAQYVARLEADGWERAEDPPGPPLPDDTIRQVWHHDRWSLTLTVEGSDSPWREFDTQVPRQDTRVEIDLGY